MMNRICILLLLQLCLFMSSTLAEGVTVTIPAEVKVNGPFMTLREVADIKGDDGERITRLGQVKLGSAPSPSHSMLLTKEMIGMRLAAAGLDLNHINWNIPETVTVTTNFQTIERKDLLDKGIRIVKEQIGAGAGSEDLSILPVGNLQDVITPAGSSMLTSSLPYGVRYNTPTTVKTVITVNGEVFTTLYLKFDVKLYSQVVVVGNQVSPGEVLTSEKLRYEKMDTGRLGTGYFTDMKKIIGLEARRPLPPGVVVTDLMLNKPIIIKRGDLVQIVARIGGIEVGVSGKAMQNGYEGQLIRVQNLNSNKFISAKVLDEGTVQVLTYNRK